MASHGVPRTSRVRTEDQRLADVKKIEIYRGLEDQVRASAAEGDFSRTLFDLTTRLVVQNPEYYTVWNIRRRCLIASLLSKPAEDAGETQEDAGLQDADLGLLKSELEFTIPLLIKYPKCYWIWNYRRWTLDEAIHRLATPVARGVWEAELGLVSKMLDRDQRNFHAWGYRRILVEKLESAELRGTSMVEAEFAYTTKMIERNLSNFSAWHHRSNLVFRLLQERGSDDKTRADFLNAELDLVREGLNVGPEDESLWHYHQFLVSQVAPETGRTTIVPALTNAERVTYLRHEVDEIKDLLEDYDSTRLIYEALLEYTATLKRLDPGSTGDVDSGAVKAWLDKLKALDPMRMGRWNDAEKI